MSILKDKIAIVTGASRGIGRAIAETYVREGARIAICGRKKEAIERVACEIGPAAMPVACHVGDSRMDQIESMVQAVTREYGRIDILVNNAGTNLALGPSSGNGRGPIRQNGRDQCEERVPPGETGGSGYVRPRDRLYH